MDAEDNKTEYFKDFLEERNEKLKIRIENSLQAFASGNDYMFLRCLRVVAVDARTDVAFNNATCKVETMGIETKDRKYMAPIGCFFLTGYKILQDFLADRASTPRVPADKFQRRALQRLLQFLSSSDHSVLAERGEGGCEATVARRYAEHLLMPLVDDKTYVIDSYPEIQYVKCCDVDHSYSGKCGDTSFGLEDGWHGNVDLLIMNNTDVELPVSFGQSSEDDVSVSESGDKVLDNEYSQMVAKTFVFSFLQYRQNPGKMQNNLIPSIGIKNEKLIVFMYDCENDVLLGSHLLDLFDEGDIDVRIVIFLWFILNYKLFCTGLIDDYKFDNYQADFQTLLDKDCLQRYRNGVTMPCHSKTSHKRSFYPNKSDVPPVLEKRVKISNLPEILQWDIFDDRC